MNKIYSIILAMLACGIHMQAQRSVNFNDGWSIPHLPSGVKVTSIKEGQTFTLPRAWNEEYAYRVPIEHLPDDTVRYVKEFVAPREWKGKKIFVEFEGARQSAEVWLNGHRIGLHQNGVMAFGFDLTPYIYIGKANRMEVLTDNDWGYKEKIEPGMAVSDNADHESSAVIRDGNNLPNNELKPSSFQWNNKNFNANYGGLPKNVRLHVVGKLYQTLPLYSALGTTGVYVYAKDIDVAGHTATIHAESQVRNETSKSQRVIYETVVIDRQDGTEKATFASQPVTIGKGETVVLSAESKVQDLHFWSWGYGYLYDVKTRVKTISGACLDEALTTTGFRKTEFGDGQFRLNDRTLMVHGYAQRTSNEWPGVGMSVPAWLSDYSNRLMVESGGNLVRWMHVCPWKQDIESCDRVGLIQAMPAGDAEKDVTGRHWEQRKELMRDAIIYNRNNPSVIFYESGNKGISEQHMQEMMQIRDEYDPHGGRAIGCREMLSVSSCAEYGGEMLYINKSATKPVWAMEYCRDEALRRYWDDWSYPYHRHGDGPLYRDADASAYNQNNDQFAIEMVRRWYDYWQERPGTGSRISSGGVKIVFSDTNTHNRGESNYRTSGVVDAMRLPKDAFYAHQVMWDGWVTPEVSRTHIVGHWNYEPGTTKPVFVISDAPRVRLFLNGKEIGGERIDYHFLHTFDSIPYQPGTLKAVSYDANGDSISSHTVVTAGAPYRLAVKYIHPSEGQLGADGADMGMIEYEVVDSEGRRCPTAFHMVHFSVDGPAEWIGGIAYRDSVKYRAEWESNPNSIRSLDLPVECGVGRALIRSTGQTGRVMIRCQAEGLPMPSAQVEIDASTEWANYKPKSSFTYSETSASPSYTDIYSTIRADRVVAGCNQQEAANSVDDSEDTEWKNDGRASTAWIMYEFAAPVRVDEIVMKLTGWRKREYPLQIYADNTLVWEGKTPTSLGYVHLPLDHKGAKASSITIRLKGTATDSEAFGQITELAAPVANELDLFKAKDGDKVRAELRIVECDFLMKK